MSFNAGGSSFQAVILKLQRYWADQGCVILQPYDVEVGAGTFHPATALRALGPEAWRAAYVQPSRRPTDGRYGENPNRLQHYYQFQVILKPAPANSQDLYLGSLAALKPKFDLYERANRVNAHPWLADLLIWRAKKSPRLLKRMSGVLNETSNPGNLVSLKGISRLFFE